MLVRQLDLQDSINGDAKSPSGELLFRVTGILSTQTLSDVIAAVVNESPGYLSFVVPNSDGFTPALLTGSIYRKAVKPTWDGAGTATAIVTYGLVDAVPHESQGGQKPEEKPPGELCGPEFSFDTTGGTTHILQSLGTRWHNLANTLLDNDAPHARNIISYSDGKVEGCDIVTGVLKFSFTVKGVPVTPAYLEKVSWMTGTINADADGADPGPAFMGFEAYSLLFLGASGNCRGGEGWVVTYSFLAGKNREDVYLPSGDAAEKVFFKNVMAHDFVWFVYKEITEDGFNIAVPKAGYVERVYESTVFRDLFTAVP